ncbi:MAG TPA: DNA polymerase IV [Acidiphilium sp.]|uniref:DNA polymerase IV n=1 Tax=unclassified Acidiphilium TaxID=2617493 RepID=UPI000BD71927|nr:MULTISPECIES: DNA polymerase IV [unclassified Acidiphilium]OYV55586.1 MAG: DNA polymerase IV [Acidiphilium sp. 20-67-58]HQT60173.1 DNA polymerase IV [Acidiphilium sp.]HQU10543.1 DNA polymerase IV [Acidiphilium sp.]
MPILCRDCDTISEAAGACPHCEGRRLVAHDEIATLAIAHIDCDAFYASVEKRDRPELADRPVIVGGGARGVVAACCYIARLSGVRSAMPMFKARKLCPDAVVIAPEMRKYASAAAEIRALMSTLTPLVQPLSIDEAALDLSGTAALHKAPPAVVLSRFARQVEAEIGVTVSIGLAPNRLLAKLAAERDKPRGFAVLGAEAAAVLAPEPVGILPGVGPALARKLAGMGITRVGQLAALDDRAARTRLGEDGPMLTARARGIDPRPIDPARATKSISAETTFAADIDDAAALARALFPLCEKLARRLRAEGFAAAGLVLKLKTARFETHTHAVRLTAPTQLAETIFEAAKPVLMRAAGPRYRLIGIGAARLAAAAEADRGDLVDRETPRRAAREDAVERLRAKFGTGIIRRGG